MLSLENKPVIIDFGKSCKIVKARLRKPKVNIEKSMNKFPHIAPEIHRGERHSIANDVFSFGYLVTPLFKDAKLEIPPVLKEVAKKCQRSIPGKRPKLVDFFTILTKGHEGPTENRLGEFSSLYKYYYYYYY